MSDIFLMDKFIISSPKIYRKFNKFIADSIKNYSKSTYITSNIDVLNNWMTFRTVQNVIV